MRVLVAHSNRLNGDIFRLHLGTLGHDVEICTSPDIFDTTLILAPETIILGDFITFLSLDNWKNRIYELTRSPIARYIFVVPNLSPNEIDDVFRAGVKGLIHFDDEVESISECLRTVASNQYYISPKILESTSSKAHPDFNHQLTPSEIEITKRLLDGQSTKEIAKELYRSVETIQNHRKAIKKKLGIQGGKLTFLARLKAISIKFFTNH